MGEKIFLKIIIVIACIQTTCALPLVVFYQYFAFQELFIESSIQTDRIVHGTFVPIFYVNFSVNPLLYVLRLPNYRKTYY